MARLLASREHSDVSKLDADVPPAHWAPEEPGTRPLVLVRQIGFYCKLTSCWETWSCMTMASSSTQFYKAGKYCRHL